MDDVGEGPRLVVIRSRKACLACNACGGRVGSTGIEQAYCWILQVLGDWFVSDGARRRSKYPHPEGEVGRGRS